jgi:hypothetical protein
MSVYHITMERGHKVARPIYSEEEYRQLRDSRQQQELLRAVREQGDATAKNRLTQFNYSGHYPDGTVKGNRLPSMAFPFDCDEKEEFERIKDVLLAEPEKYGLLMLERSARQGGHAVLRREKGKTILENQVRIATMLRTEMDCSTHDINRVLFATSASADDLLYLSPALFEDRYDADAVAEEARMLEEREHYGLEELPEGAHKVNKHFKPWEREAVKNRTTATEGTETVEGEGATVLQCYSSFTDDTTTGDGVGEYPKEYHGIAFSDIIRVYWELFNDGREPQKGDRDTLTYQLACDLRHICGRNERWLDEVIPCYDGFPLEEKRKKILSALQAKSEGMPYRLKQVLQVLRSTTAIKACGGTLTTPPPMPKRLPPLMRLLTRNVPECYKAAVASAVFPALATHLHGVHFRYWDNVEHEATLEHEATFMNVLIGRQSIGKGSIKKPIEFIVEDIRQRDIPNRQREAEWKQKNPSAKQKKDPRPTDICIQMLIDNLTDAVFNQRIVDANNNGERFIYTIVDEIDALKKVTSRGTVDEVGLLIRKAFDNSLAGQERVGADSVSGIAPLRWNFNASTTPPNARKFFNRMVNDGTVSRLDVSTIIRSDEDEDKAPILGIYDYSFASELKPYIDRLEAASGLIECAQAKKLALQMRQENSDAARLYDSEAYRVFSYRANVIAWLKGMVLYVAQRYQWDKTTADFVRWSQQYNLWCKMLYFGQQLEKELREEVEMQRQSGPQNLLELLPDEFSREEYQLMRQRQGRNGDGWSTLRTWSARGYIAHDEVTGRYCKTKEYKKRGLNGV